ncbi:two-component regulator propeller domain-containing protein [Pedobacter nototheniae]|uniref:hybrid sensor histidine kinase/response regulator transcription factor n=1 Tax=Pedobacter nototheniae TaxID=2488994 RepID=UPI002931D368|nr:two-component regulator propeller domain-containing protein [Pedobacter nototheniae]
MRYSLLIYFIIFLNTSLYAQEIRFRHLNVENGLSQTSVLSVTQDKKGFMWFATRSGLNRYDSKSIKVYKRTDDTTSLSSSYVVQLLADHEGALWVVTTLGLNIYNERSDDFLRIKHNKSNKNSIGSNYINDMYQDHSNRMWFCTKEGLSLLTNKKSLKFKNIRFTNESISECYTIFEDRQGTFWLSTNKGLALMKFDNDKISLHFTSFGVYNKKINAVADNHVTSIAQDLTQTIWLGSKQTGLSSVDKSNNNFKDYDTKQENNRLVNRNIRKIILANDGKLWIGTIQGIKIFDPATQQFSILEHDPADSESLSQNSVYSIYQDKQGIFWVGTYYGGINYVTPNLSPFKKYPVSKSGNALNNNVISSMLEDRKGNVWICTEGGGLNFFNKAENRFTHYTSNTKNAKGISSNILKAIIQDREDNIWIGTYLGKLDVYNPHTNAFRHYQSNPDDVNSLNSTDVNCLLEDSKGRIWIGTDKGLHKYSKDKNNFVRFSHSGLTDKILYIFEDRSGNVWVSTTSDLYVLKKNAAEFIKEVSKPLLKEIQFEDICYINEDQHENLWFATTISGVVVFHPKTNTVKKIDKNNGLSSNNITCILIDDNGDVWLSSDKGISKYISKKKYFINYDTRDGLSGNEFNYRSALKTRSGQFFFGGLTGLTSFFPNQIKTNHRIPNIIFTDLKLFNKSVAIGAYNNLLDSNISLTKAITLKWSQNVFSVDFAILNFVKADKNKYGYKLEGFEKNWNYVSTPTASYTNLSPGNYTLLVKGSNNDGYWAAPIKLNIKVLPPFYRTWWAYLFYLCMIAILFFIVIRYLLIRAVFEKEKEINEYKLEFFTHISHEIRTPLTLIVGPLEKLMDKAQYEAGLYDVLQPIKNNTDRLMNLVNELLDFRKAESGKMSLQVSPGNIVKFCKEIFLAFQNLAINNNINYNFKSQIEETEIYFDKPQFEKVLFNLLSNAFKFTQTGGCIDLMIEEHTNTVIIYITDNGKGIPLNKQKGLFSNFYQVSPSIITGTGLGLSLSKSIIELHQGSISVKSKEKTHDKNGETCFTVILKKGNKHFKDSDLITDYLYDDDLKNYTENQLAMEQSIEKSIDFGQESNSLEKYTVLLVEDNLELRSFIKNTLQDQYNIYESENGIEAWNLALDVIPDLILSDVMMPEMDGLELCRKLKTDERTSHIPVVLLTARSTHLHQINGFESGADAYIMKPFSIKILLLNIHNLLQARETIKKKFEQVVTLDPKNLVINLTEQKFINKVLDFMEQNISNPKFDVAMLSNEVGMSLPILYKKIRALTGLSVNDFIKSFRLKKAAQILKQNKGNISQTAFSVGFQDRKYFSSEFKKQFGKTPTEFIQEEKK